MEYKVGDSENRRDKRIIDIWHKLLSSNKKRMRQRHSESGVDGMTHVTGRSLTVFSTSAGSEPASSFPATTATYCRDQRASLAREWLRPWRPGVTTGLSVGVSANMALFSPTQTLSVGSLSDPVIWDVYHMAVGSKATQFVGIVVPHRFNIDNTSTRKYIKEHVWFWIMHLEFSWRL